MEYRVAVEFYENAEFGFVLYEGESLRDGEIEPDLVAELVARGVLEPVSVEQDED